MVTVVVVTELAVSRLVVAKNSFLFLLVQNKLVRQKSHTWRINRCREKSRVLYNPPPTQQKKFLHEGLRPALQLKTYLCIPFLGIGRPKSQFLHSCVCERFIYSQDQSTYFLQQAIHCKKCRRTFRRIPSWCWKNTISTIFLLSSHVFFFYPANEQESSTLAQYKNFVLVSD